MSFTAQQIGNVSLSDTSPLVVISGPCVIESLPHALSTARTLKEMCAEAGVQLIYKSSYDKANRSSSDAYRGPGMEEGLRILEEVGKRYHLPLLTDVHLPEEVDPVARVCDIIQIPALLCRQTDLLLAAGRSKKVVNIKKGQFMAPWDMRYAVDKVLSTRNKKIILTERGTFFGYNRLVSDMRSLPVMKDLGFPVCFDASHSVQLPGSRQGHSGGQKEFIPTLARAALAAGADLLFVESHPDPARAKSDGDSVLSFADLPPFLRKARLLHDLLRQEQCEAPRV